MLDRAWRDSRSFMSGTNLWMRLVPAIAAPAILRLQFHVSEITCGSILHAGIAVAECYGIAFVVVFAWNGAAAFPAMLQERDTQIAELRAALEDALSPKRNLRASPYQQSVALMSLIQQMGQLEMWLSDIFARGAGAFSEIPGAGLVDYPAALKLLAARNFIGLLESKRRSYKDFYGETFMDDVKFRRL
ncbi:MAG TPA: hypothetical protein VIO10_14285 [Candidatus Binatus sp.]